MAAARHAVYYVTTADEWLKLFDHIVAVGREMLPHLAAAFLVIWRDTILAAPEGSTAIKQLFARDAGTSLPRLLKTAYELRHEPHWCGGAQPDEVWMPPRRPPRSIDPPRGGSALDAQERILPRVRGFPNVRWIGRRRSANGCVRRMRFWHVRRW